MTGSDHIWNIIPRGHWTSKPRRICSHCGREEYRRTIWGVDVWLQQDTYNALIETFGFFGISSPDHKPRKQYRLRWNWNFV